MHEIKRLIKIWLAMSPVAIIKFIRPRSITLENKEIFISKYSQISTHALIAKSATDPPSLPPPLLPTNLPDNLIYSSLQLPFPPPSRDQPLTSVTFWGKIGVFFLIKFILRIKYWNSTRIMLAQHNSLQSSFLFLLYHPSLSPVLPSSSFTFHDLSNLPLFFILSPSFSCFSLPSLPSPSIFIPLFFLHFILHFSSPILLPPLAHLAPLPLPFLSPLPSPSTAGSSPTTITKYVGSWCWDLTVAVGRMLD